VQIVLSLFNTGRYAAFFLPTTVVEAMLAAIGAIIIIKQIPALLGVFAPPAKGMLTSIAGLPDVAAQLDPAIFAIGGVCLFLMFYLNRTRHGWLQRVPAPLFVAAVGIGLGYLLQLDAKYLITMPQNLIEGGITLPAFDAVWSRPELWGGILLVVITLTLIDGIESLATIAAVDKIDPYQRKSDPNVTLRAMGVSNTLSSIVGGLTIIPGGVKSRVNIDAGGRTLWANFYNAVFLLIFLFVAKDLISRIPLAAIGAILVYVGWRLCEFRVFSRTYAIGREQMVIFVVTIAAILATDLLYGILIGIAAEIALLVYLLTPLLRAVLTGRLSLLQSLKLLINNLADLFRSPVIKLKLEERAEGPHYRLSLGSVVCFNLLSLDKVLNAIPQHAGITLAVTESSRIVDHTAMEYLHQFQEACVHAGRPFEIIGLEHFYPFTAHALSSRMHDAKLVKEKARVSTREQQMAEVAQAYGLQFKPDTVGTLNSHGFVYLRRGGDRQESNVMTGRYQNCHVKLFDYSHTAAPDYYLEHLHTLVMLRCLENEQELPNLAITPGDYLERYLVEYQEVDLTDRPALAQHYRLYAQDPAQARSFVVNQAERLLKDHPGFYIEIRDNVLLAFRPAHELESPESIKLLFDFVELAGSARASERN